MYTDALGIPEAWWQLLFDGNVREVRLDQEELRTIRFDTFLGAVRRVARSLERKITTRQWPDQRLLAIQAYGPGTLAPAPMPVMLARRGPLPEFVDRLPMPKIKPMVTPLTKETLGTMSFKMARFADRPDLGLGSWMEEQARTASQPPEPEEEFPVVKVSPPSTPVYLEWAARNPEAAAERLEQASRHIIEFPEDFEGYTIVG